MINIKVLERIGMTEVPSGVVLYYGKDSADAEIALAAISTLYPEATELASMDSSHIVKLAGDFDKVTEIVEDYEKHGIKKLANTPGTEKSGWLDAWYSVRENLELYKGTHIGKYLEDVLLDLSDIAGVVWVDLRDSALRYGEGVVLMSKESVGAVNDCLSDKNIQVRDVYYFGSRRGAEWFSSYKAVSDARDRGIDYTDLYGVILEAFGSDLWDRTSGRQFQIRPELASKFEPGEW